MNTVFAQLLKILRENQQRVTFHKMLNLAEAVDPYVVIDMSLAKKDCMFLANFIDGSVSIEEFDA